MKKKMFSVCIIYFVQGFDSSIGIDMNNSMNFLLISFSDFFFFFFYFVVQIYIVHEHGCAHPTTLLKTYFEDIPPFVIFHLSRFLKKIFSFHEKLSPRKMVNIRVIQAAEFMNDLAKRETDNSVTVWQTF